MDEENYEAHEAMRRQVEATLRYMVISTLIGLVVIVVLAVAISDIRGVLILVGIIYLLTSLGAYVYLRRTLNQRLQRGIPPIEVE